MGNAVEYRRELHQIPELGFELTQTLAFLEGVLGTLPCRILKPVSGSVCAFFDAGKPKSIAYRADMDALPIAERTGLAFASAAEGRMHACGHDGHMAIALALAEYAAEYLPALPNNALIIFQPAEETTGGALPICQTGLLEEFSVGAVFGMHLWPGIPAGQIAARPGPVMAQSSETTLEFFGKAAHIASASEGADALEAAARFLAAAYDLEKSVATATALPRLLKFGHMHSGSARNAISPYTRLEGSMRAFSPGDVAALRENVRKAAESACNATGCTHSVHYSTGYPPVTNDEALLKRVCSIPGVTIAPLKEPSLTSEDFSYYGQHAPSAFFMLGTGRDLALHSACFDFDEAALADGLAFAQRLLYLNLS